MKDTLGSGLLSLVVQWNLSLGSGLLSLVVQWNLSLESGLYTNPYREAVLISEVDLR